MIETTDQVGEAVLKTLKRINQVLDKTEGPVPTILVECIECLAMGAKITIDYSLSIEIALTGLKICQRVKLDNLVNFVETFSTILIQRFTDKI